MIAPTVAVFTTCSVTGEDSDGNDVLAETEFKVPALWAQTGNADNVAVDTPNEDVADMHIYVHSRSFVAGTSLRGAKVTVEGLPGRSFVVVGNPIPYPPALVTREWDMEISVREVSG